jgi:2-polyprenyl-3-methyl-5-hydroxy-6-metoxy-1,4-benzoquinol methylase
VKREDWDRRYAQVENLWSARPNRFLVGEVADLEPGSALDLACGEGQNAIWLAQQGWTVRGVDYSAVAIEKARARAAREQVAVDFVQADLVEYEPEVAAFDLVCVLYLHIPATERPAIHARAARAVAPGGTFVLVGHDLTNLTQGVGGPSDPALLYTPDGIAAELEGLEIERAERVLRDVAGADRPAIDTLVRARR